MPVPVGTLPSADAPIASVAPVPIWEAFTREVGSLIVTSAFVSSSTILAVIGAEIVVALVPVQLTTGTVMRDVPAIVYAVASLSTEMFCGFTASVTVSVVEALPARSSRTARLVSA